MEFLHYDVHDHTLGGAHHRFIQPPQVAYFVSTIDENGNTNVAPITMGTCIANRFFSFTLSNLREKDWDLDKHPLSDGIKHSYVNLRTTPECVISYYGHDLLRESWVAAMPVPKGISEIDVMGLTHLASSRVKPDGIAECPVNLEAKVLHAHKLGERWSHYVCEIVHVAVHKALVERNASDPLKGYGMLHIDPLFEVYIGKGDGHGEDGHRLVYDRLDLTKLERCPEDIGCKNEWPGIHTFHEWIAEERARGKISDREHARILELEALWLADASPLRNATVRAELSALLRKAAMGV